MCSHKVYKPNFCVHFTCLAIYALLYLVNLITVYYMKNTDY